MKLSVVIPAFNEIENLRITLPRLAEVLKKCPLVTDYEFIVVDDHSTEPMYEALESLQDPRVHCLRLSRQGGSHIALRAGLAATGGDAVLCISADGQEDPAAIPAMLEHWQSGAHIVWGLRFERSGESFLLKTFSLLFYRMLAMLTESKGSIDLSRADFYLLDRRVVDALNSLREANSSLFGLVAWIGYRQDFVEYERRERQIGKSKWRFRARMRLAKDWVIAFSGIPLKVMTVMGFAVAALGMLYALWVMGVAIFGEPIQGWASIMVVVLIIGGLQMAMLGIMGEYLWRTLEETRQRKLYFIEKSTVHAPAISLPNTLELR
jgi:glycosyltransferase involved in cell wall biosynthesis